LKDVVLRGSRSGQAGEAKTIAEEYFYIPRCLANYPNSLERDYERGIATSSQVDKMRSSLSDDATWTGSQGLDGGRFNVEVEVGSLLKWLVDEIAVERERQLNRRRSQRLFDYPFWSVETALCWIAFRDSSCLKTRKNETERLFYWAERRNRHTYSMVESQPEIRLLSFLKEGKIKAREGAQVLPNRYWANHAPVAGGVSPVTQSVRLAREDVLRIFPEKMRCAHSDVRTCRHTKIDRIVERMQRTRKWISCHEIGDWIAPRAGQRPGDKSRLSPAFDRLKATFVAGGFHSHGRSQLYLLSADTSVVRLFCQPVDRTVGAEGFRYASVPNHLERCWLPSEMCRAWFEQQRLSWPAHFERPPLPIKIPPKSPDVETTNNVGRPSIIKPYKEEFERRLTTGTLCKTQKAEANRLINWGELNIPEKKLRAKPGTITNHIRERLKTWDGPIPWK
jgi:hypothetical protein